VQDTRKQWISEVPQDGSQLNLTHVWKLLTEVSIDVEEMKRQQVEYLTAFSLNDLNKADLDGHRRQHIQLTKAQQVMDGYKYEMTKKVLGVLTGALVTFLVMAVKQHYGI